MMELIKQMNDEQLAKQLVEIKRIIEEIEVQFEEVKKELQKRNPKEIIFIPEYQSKVYMTEGRSSSEYNVMKIFSDMCLKGVMEEFPKIVKINQSQVEEIKDIQSKNITKAILLENGVVKVGESSITVRKMTKQELLEHTK
jgi:hypothetical protein